MASASDELIVDVVTDLHYDDDSVKGFTKPVNPDDPYAHVSSSGQLYVESFAVISAFLEKAAADSSSAVIIPGDLADDGVKAEHEAVAEMLRNFEATTGKSVYVVPGNHDVARTTISEFESIYADFGFNEAIAKDSLSASYVAELSEDYILLAIDSTNHNGGGDWGFTAERVEWIRQQAEKAQNDGKKVIAMFHHNLLNHLVLIDLILSGGVVGNAFGLRDIFAQYGVKYIFTGHTHEHDIATYTAPDGQVIYDAVTGSLSSYPCPYRQVTFGDEVKFETKYVDKIDTSLVKGTISDEAYELMTNDFTQYSKKCVFKGVGYNINNYFVTPTKIKSLLKIDAKTEPEMCALIDEIIPKGKEVINMPLYASDEAEEGKSMESILSSYGVTIPDTKYETFLELALTLYEAHVAGDESYPSFTKEVVLASKGIGAVLIYMLSDVSAEEYTMALGFVCKLLNADVPAELISYAGDAIDRFEGIELVISTAILPLILKLTNDDGAADCNVTLPGYTDLVEGPAPELSFGEKIKAFFIKIFSFIMSLFAFI
jgi:predicted MPP superfamily phosphohydrolase